MKNIILIGIMGSGKTTFGKILSQKTGHEMIDLDDYLVNRFNMSIPDMFAISEDYFSNNETTCCQEVSELEGKIISTGGGVIKRPENMTYLKKNGVVFYIDRPIEDIVKDVDPSGRPLLKDGPDKLYALDKERRDKYMSSCDYHIINDGSLEKVIDTILDIMKEYDISPL